MFSTIFGKKTTVKRVGSGVLAAALGLGVCLAPSAAYATVAPDGVPTAIELGNTSVLIQVGGVNYMAFLSGAPAGCSNVSADTLKGWTTFAQTALLAGRNVRIFFTTCNSPNTTPVINLMDIR